MLCHAELVPEPIRVASEEFVEPELTSEDRSVHGSGIRGIEGQSGSESYDGTQ